MRRNFVVAGLLLGCSMITAVQAHSTGLMNADGVPRSIQRISGAAAAPIVDARIDPDPVELNVSLDWVAGATNNGIWANISLRPDRMLVTTRGLDAAANDFETGCSKNIRPHGGPVTIEQMQQVLNCEDQTSTVNSISPHRAVFLPIGEQPQKCTDTNLTNGIYRICAAILRWSSDSFDVEYQENLKTGGIFSVTRARFQINLQRYPRSSLLAGRINGCSVILLDGATFNPNQPQKLAHQDRVTGARCTRQ
jgi:hypothetical protein